MKESVKLWLEALESGEYNQCRATLKFEESFCCLGVAVDVYNKYHNINAPIEGANLGVYPEVQKWLGLRNSYGNIKDNVNLTTLNDLDRYSFKQIAEVIRNNQKELFVDES